LRDEQIYIAHKAANPTKYPPSKTVLDDYPNQADAVNKYKPTKVQLQVFDGCAHVIPTLSVTTPAKYMYRSAANFNIWAIIDAKRKSKLRSSRNNTASTSSPKRSAAPSFTSTPDDGNLVLGLQTKSLEPDSMLSSPISSVTADEEIPGRSATAAESLDMQSEMTDSSLDSESDVELHNENGMNGVRTRKSRKPSGVLSDRIIVSGSLPTFGPGNIIRQRASCHGRLRQMEPEEEVKALNLPTDQIGRVHIDGPVSYWLETRQRFHKKYGKELAAYRQIKSDDYVKAKQNGFLTRDLYGEDPPQCALASWYDLDLAQQVGRSVDEPGGKTNAAVSLYMRISQKADREQVGDVCDVHSQDAIEKVRSRHVNTLDSVASRGSQADPNGGPTSPTLFERFGRHLSEKATRQDD
jgi:hypothetical protein